MKIGSKHSQISIVAALLWLLLAACSSSGSGDDGSEVRPTLSINIYAPDQAMPTRAGGVVATAAEDSIKSMQIWVFKSADGSRLGYLYLTEEQLSNLNSSIHSESYRMEIPKDFAEHPTDVDVCVLANVTDANCGITLGERITKGELLDYQMKSAYFFETGTTVYQSRYGLPMTVDSVSQSVAGSNMVLHIVSGQVQLRRAVSRIQFAFSKSAAREGTSIRVEEIELDGGLIPSNEYLFLGAGSDYRSTATYLSAATTLVNKPFEMKSDENPEQYVYKSDTDGSVSAYMDKVKQAVEAGKIALSPAVYLRETDRPLAGTIYYSVNGDRRSARFSMSPLSRLYRNQTWLVYGYFNAGELTVSTVTINDWQEGGSKDQEIYNW